MIESDQKEQVHETDRAGSMVLCEGLPALFHGLLSLVFHNGGSPPSPPASVAAVAAPTGLVGVKRYIRESCSETESVKKLSATP